MSKETFEFDGTNHNIMHINRVLTDERIDNGEYSDQTVIDLRDCIISLLEENRFLLEKQESLCKRVAKLDTMYLELKYGRFLR